MLRGSLVELCWAAFFHFYFRDAFLACLGCFLGLIRTLWESVGPPLGASWASLGDLGVSLGPSWPCWALVGPLLGCSFGLSSALLDSLGLLSWPKSRPGSDEVPQDSPKSRPRDPQGSQNGPPKSANFVSFLGSFFELSSGLLFGRVLGRLAP